MPKPIANINGKNVYSDKKVVRIENSRIFFSDGSYVDVITGDIANKGKGYITIGEPLEGVAPDKKKTIEKNFCASAREIKDLAATVDIQPCSGREIAVKVSGPESGVKDLAIYEEKGTVVVSKKDDGNDGGSISMSFSGDRFTTKMSGVRGRNISCGGISIINGDITIVGKTTIATSGDSADIRIDIEVPVGTALNISDVNGDVTVGDVKGAFRAKINGEGKIITGEVAKVSAAISGAGNIQIASAKGNVNLKISGSGKIAINGGTIDSLDARVSGVGNVQVDATAEEADLSVSGSGNIYVSRVEKRPYKNVSGVGKITIGNW
jgi:hypothetical protein